MRSSGSPNPSSLTLRRELTLTLLGEYQMRRPDRSVVGTWLLCLGAGTWLR